jgi:HlyD family secretion protein
MTDLDQLLRQKTSKRGRLMKWGGIALGILVLLLLLARCFAPPKPLAFATTPVTRGDLVVTVSATGNLAPTKQVNLGSEVSGLVAKVYVQNNDRVIKGQPLASLDLSLLQASLLQSQAALKVAQATLAQNKATVQLTQATLARYEQVSKLSESAPSLRPVPSKPRRCAMSAFCSATAWLCTLPACFMGRSVEWRDFTPLTVAAARTARSGR